MKVLILDDYKSMINDYLYKKNQKIEVVELEGFEENYAVYGHDGLDWIPKNLVKVIKQ